MKTMRIPSILSSVILGMMLLGIWIVFAPINLGGSISYVIVNGISMEPGFHLGDLTIISKATNYQIGDVVTYRDPRMNAYVIHRIIGVENDRFVLKGDNNSWVDVFYPTNEEIIGKLWIHIPKLGKLFEWLRMPLHMALSLGLLGGVLMSGMILTPSKDKRSKNLPARTSTGSYENGLYIFGFFVLTFLTLNIFMFLRPLTRTADKIEFTQQSQFSYSATGTPIIYDTDMVRSGEPVFPRLTCFLNIGFAYNALAENLQQVTGNYQLIARVMDEQTGWQRTIPMSGITPFNGSAFSTTSTLDLCQIVTLVQILEQETGLRAGNYKLEITPQIAMSANVSGLPINDLFEPKLIFKFDDVSFSLVTPGGQNDPLNVSKQLSIDNPLVETNTLSLPGMVVSILTMRIVALIGLVISLTGLLISGVHLYSATKQNPETLIRLRYGSLLVHARDQEIRTTGSVINIDNVDELAKLAERHNTVILHTTFNSLHSYIVQCNGTTYRHIDRSKKAIADMYSIEPVRNEITQPIYTVGQDNLVATEQEESELVGYILSKHRTEMAEVEETVVLRKIRL